MPSNFLEFSTTCRCALVFVGVLLGARLDRTPSPPSPLPLSHSPSSSRRIKKRRKVCRKIFRRLWRCKGNGGTYCCTAPAEGDTLAIANVKRRVALYVRIFFQVEVTHKAERIFRIMSKVSQEKSIAEDIMQLSGIADGLRGCVTLQRVALDEVLQRRIQMTSWVAESFLRRCSWFRSRCLCQHESC